MKSYNDPGKWRCSNRFSMKVYLYFLNHSLQEGPGFTNAIENMLVMTEAKATMRSLWYLQFISRDEIE